MFDAPDTTGAPLLLAEDDPDDQYLLLSTFRRCRVPVAVKVVANGEELMDYLHQRGVYADPALAPRPSLILLDLNMPRKDGREALREIKSSSSLRPIPVVVLTTSKSEQDVSLSYELGVNAFLTKPVGIDDLMHTVRVLHDFWYRTVRLPGDTLPS